MKELVWWGVGTFEDLNQGQGAWCAEGKAGGASRVDRRSWEMGHQGSSRLQNNGPFCLDQ